MANTHYKLLSALKEKKANTSAGMSAPTAQPISPIKPAAGMPGSGPLAAGGAGGMSTSAPPVLGGGTGLSAGTDQPAGFVAGMNQKSQEAQMEQEKALGDAQGQAQKLQQDQLNQQAKAQQDQLSMQQQAQQKELDMQVQNQQQVFKKDEELHRTKMELETLKAQTNATQAASAATPGVSPLLPTTAKRIASKANSLMKKMSYGLPSLLAKQAYTYTPPAGIANKQYGGASSLGTSSMQGPKTPTSIAQGRMYNNGASSRRDIRQRPSTAQPSRSMTSLAAPAVAAQRAVPMPVAPPTPSTPSRVFTSAARPGNIPMPGSNAQIAPSAQPVATKSVAPGAPAHISPKAKDSQVSWLNALFGRPVVSNEDYVPGTNNMSPEAYDEWYRTKYGEDPITQGTDPRYYDARSLQKKILQMPWFKERGMSPKTPLEAQKIKDQPWLDPSEGWFKGWSPNVKEKLEPGLDKLRYGVTAIPDIAKNYVIGTYDKMLGGGLGVTRGWQKVKENAPLRSYEEDAPQEFFSGVKQMGAGAGNVLSAGLNAATFLPSPALGASWITKGLIGLAGPTLVGTASELVDSRPAQGPQGLDWHEKAKALELGITPDDPNFYDKLTAKYEQYYNGKVPESVNKKLEAMGASPAASGSTTNASTLQGTGYLHGDKIFNPMQRAVGPYQNMFLNMFTPQPQMYPTGGYNPASMMSAFNDSAQRFGAPAYYDQYRGANAMFSGNMF